MSRPSSSRSRSRLGHPCGASSPSWGRRGRGRENSGGENKGNLPGVN